MRVVTANADYAGTNSNLLFYAVDIDGKRCSLGYLGNWDQLDDFERNELVQQILLSFFRTLETSKAGLNRAFMIFLSFHRTKAHTRVSISFWKDLKGKDQDFKVVLKNFYFCIKLKPDKTS